MSDCKAPPVQQSGLDGVAQAAAGDDPNQRRAGRPPMPYKVEVAHVPCNGCTACCRWELIFLMPECGDDPSMYLTEPAWNPVSQREGYALQHKEDGSCIYLGEKGCTIHDHAPIICKEFDCRLWYLSIPRAERRRREKAGITTREVMKAGMLRAKTLFDDKGERR
jgi:hypothetical protein